MLNALNALLGSETRAAVLGHLLLRPEQEVHLRELVRITGFSPRSVNKEVDRLVSAGFLLERRSSNRRYLRANKGHQLFKELHDIIDKTVGIVPAIEAVLAQERGIKLALLFGSAAAGSEGPTSDVDLLVVGSISLARVLKVTRAIQERTGREINPVQQGALHLEHVGWSYADSRG
jgi:predicted nucleotidyltransferase